MWWLFFCPGFREPGHFCIRAERGAAGGPTSHGAPAALLPAHRPRIARVPPALARLTHCEPNQRTRRPTARSLRADPWGRAAVSNRAGAAGPACGTALPAMWPCRMKSSRDAA
ncbi:hypothetical protein ACRUKS_09420 [Burkholderia pseudomallei]|uniref:hypothetical protein n=2 Tax=Burkholderia pseudomallei TaxID=28450 RepID=UPI0004739ABA|nr:hypothetical protein [Burkholderia pseudomallei]AJW56584.1 hypothetical protein UQ47_26605 [Burkholderia pseudomallei]APZ01617.1 hypothetical protein BGI49_21460 [Burkholderia pseudomallei]APZ15203.1 hypothetical protein BGI52_21565 [Burkholderia pseudomallei]ARL05777.1 hypothetical protein BOC44_30035 [Burkholderia pseudomallei]ARM05010.1 hypothetical protein BOC59_36435 [Burkholderia pseudomallei]